MPPIAVAAAAAPDVDDPAQAFGQLTHYGGFDWAKAEHHALVVDRQGHIVLSLRFANDADGWAHFRRKVAAFPGLGIAIETNCGPAVERLLDMGLTLYPLNPKAAERYRDRKAPAGAKDDALDAWSIADGLRTDGRGWRPLRPQDPLTTELRLLCRDEVALIEQRTALVNQLKAALHEYYPAALDAFDDWTGEGPWRFVITFPSPDVLVKAGRRKQERFLHANKLYRPQTAEQRLSAFAAAKAFANPNAAVTRAKMLLAVTLAKQLCSLESQLREYRARIIELFDDHPDHDCFGSLPGAGAKIAPRLLSELGANRAVFATAEALQGYRRHLARHETVGPQPVRHRPPSLQQDAAGHRPLVGRPLPQKLRLGRGLLPEEEGRRHGPRRGAALPRPALGEDPLDDVAEPRRV